jgi:hypothetical protein
VRSKHEFLIKFVSDWFDNGREFNVDFVDFHHRQALMKRVGLLVLLLPLLATGPEKLVKTKISEGIIVTIPSDLKPMPPEDVAQRYPSVRAPLGAFTNEDRVVDFTVNISATQWPDENLEMAEKFFKAGIYNLYDRIELIGEGIYEVRKKRFIYFEFESRVNGTKTNMGEQQPIKRYTFIQYLLEPGRAIVFTFSCPQDQRQDWEVKAKAIMKSIKMK